jgi:outer membrane lipoprotein-sorting protein
MKNVLTLAALLACAALAPAAAQVHAAVLSDQQQATLSQVAAYLNAIRTIKARFLQTAPDGKIAQGTAWLERPGRMRFQYDPPSPLLLVAGAGTVTL